MSKNDDEKFAHRKPASGGIACKKCGCKHCPVNFTRHGDQFTRRNRTCRNCGNTFNTYER